MKKGIAWLVVVCLLFAFAGCGGTSAADPTVADAGDGQNNRYDNTYEQNNEQEVQPNAGNEAEKHLTSVYICRSFLATGCAQIENLDYDKYGYPCSGTYTCYCQSCGKDLGGGGFGTSGAFGVRRCFDCGETCRYEIKANCDWIEVEE